MHTSAQASGGKIFQNKVRGCVTDGRTYAYARFAIRDARYTPTRRGYRDDKRDAGPVAACLISASADDRGAIRGNRRRFRVQSSTRHRDRERPGLIATRWTVDVARRRRRDWSGRRVPLSRTGTPSSPLRGSRTRETAARGDLRAVTLSHSPVLTFAAIFHSPRHRSDVPVAAARFENSRSRTYAVNGSRDRVNPPATPRDSEFKYPHICTFFFKSRFVCLSLHPRGSPYALNKAARHEISCVITHCE